MPFDGTAVAALRSARVLQGPAGLQTLRHRIRCAVPDPAAFSMELQEVDLGAVRLTDWRTSAVSVEPAPDDGVVLVMVLDGTLSGVRGDDRFQAGAGELAVLGRRRPSRLALPEGGAIQALRLPAEVVPDALHDAVATSGVAPATEASVAVRDGLQRLVQAALVKPVPSTYLGPLLLAACLALLDERQSRVAGGSSGLRARIEAYVEEHLGDASLSPRSVAEAFEVSLRWVHQAFDRDGETLARHIRSRRADAIAAEVAAQVRDGTAPAPTADLAMRHGLSGREHLSRVFRARYGCTVPEFRDAVGRGDEPRPVDAADETDEVEARTGA